MHLLFALNISCRRSGNVSIELLFGTFIRHKFAHLQLITAHLVDSSINSEKRDKQSKLKLICLDGTPLHSSFIYQLAFHCLVNV